MNFSKLSPGLQQLVCGLAEPFHGFFLPVRYKAFYGGRGSGKSYGAVVALLAIASLCRVRVVCGREFMVTLAQSVRQLLVALIYVAGDEDNWDIQESTIEHRYTGSFFFFKGLARNPDNIKSLEGADIALIEEAQTISAISLEYLIPTIRSGGSQIWFLWNPRNKTDPVDEMFRGQFPPDRTEAFIRKVSWRDNPVFEQSPMFKDMRRARKRDKPGYLHTWEGEYRNASGAAILENWTEGVIDVPQGARPLFGADWGWHPDPNTLMKCYELENNVLYIEHEAYRHQVAAEHLGAFFDGVPGSRAAQFITADSADPRMFNAAIKAGFRMKKAEKGPGSVLAGINYLRGKDIVIHPRCKHTIQEAKDWSWKIDKKTGKPIFGEPEDGNDHCWDAVRYATEANIKGGLIIRTLGGAPKHPPLIRPNANEPGDSAHPSRQ